MKKIKLSQYAKLNNITYKTAHKWIKDNVFPSKYEYTPSGSIFVHVEDDNLINNTKPYYIYGRVSSHPKKEDLLRQIDRCKSFCEVNGWVVDKIYKEIGSGMNDNRTQFCKLLDQPVGIIIVEHKDRLTRFGFNYIDKLYTKLGGKIIVINRDETEENDLMKDLISIITSFCCRLYGMRRGYSKAKELKDKIENI
jgi:predicted site-specific integrase-resolvase